MFTLHAGLFVRWFVWFSDRESFFLSDGEGIKIQLYKSVLLGLWAGFGLYRGAFAVRQGAVLRSHVNVRFSRPLRHTRNAVVLFDLTRTHSVKKFVCEYGLKTQLEGLCSQKNLTSSVRNGHDQ